MGYRYEKKTSRLEPVAVGRGGDWVVDVDYSYNQVDTSVVETAVSGTITTLGVDFKVPPNENILPSSFRAETAFGRLTSLNGKVVLASEAANPLAPALAVLTPLSSKFEMLEWSVASPTNTFKITALASRVSQLPIDSLAFRLPVAPIKAESVQILATLTAESGGDVLNLRFNKQGIIDTPLAQGFIDYQTGLVTLRFVKKVDLTGTDKGSKLASGTSGGSSSSGNDGAYSRATQYSYNRTYEYWGVEHKGDLYKGTPTHVEIGGTRIFGYEPLLALAETLRYNAVGYSYLPLDKDILGVDTVKLPPSGKVPAYRKGDLILIKSEQEKVLTDLSLGTPHPIGKSRLSLIELVDALGIKIPFSQYDIDLDAGTVTLLPTFVASNYQAPITAKYRYQDMAVAQEVSISGDIKLTKQLTHDFDPANSLVSSALMMGTMQARVHGLFTQGVWRNKFLDVLEGDDSLFKYDTALAPIEVTNESSYEEDWALVMKTSTSFDLIGKNVGKIASGTTNEDFAPLNPSTGKPLMVLRAIGFSDGAVSGNVLRFKTTSCNYPVWVVRTVLQSEPTSESHEFSLEFKGNRDRIL